ncbi:hypothetical protein [Asticcacaulis sp. EMRT-3]|uniref:hypothetical protein n=1 Tax=Asticcacaulis sp. EMRT-3 TaxID=3040349 RepID=UPI0024AF4057|nr:hypothetical protein [Asticcacaulis sp. EMRT-3]MDI7774693.1 hypothetical protein [Asticcacaulis sp. EMRT-3]
MAVAAQQGNNGEAVLNGTIGAIAAVVVDSALHETPVAFAAPYIAAATGSAMDYGLQQLHLTEILDADRPEVGVPEVMSATSSPLMASGPSDVLPEDGLLLTESSDNDFWKPVTTYPVHIAMSTEPVVTIHDDDAATGLVGRADASSYDHSVSNMGDTDPVATWIVPDLDLITAPVVYSQDCVNDVGGPLTVGTNDLHIFLHDSGTIADPIEPGTMAYDF